MKKGQGGGSAAALVALIGLIIVLYILFLPPADREKLLSNNFNEESEITTTYSEILKVSPGTLSEISKNEYEHYVPSVNIFTKTEGNLLKDISSGYTDRKLFSEETFKIEFTVNDLQKTKNALLSFLILDHNGKLNVELNGQKIFNQEPNVKNINIKLENLVEGTNIIKIYPEDPGWTFWANKFFELSNIKVTANIKDTSKTSSETYFTVTPEEKNNLESSKLSFYVSCNTKSENLNIAINDKQIYSGIPNCKAPITPIELSSDDFVIGQNKLKFKVTNGDYLLEQIRVRTKINDERNYVYYFKIEDATYDLMLDGIKDIDLNLDFLKDEYKEGNLEINGYQRYFETSKDNYELKLNEYVKRGNNYIKIIPKNTLNIVEMTVQAK